LGAGEAAADPPEEIGRSGNLMDVALYRRRKIINLLSLGACYGTMIMGLTALGAILYTLVSHGLPALQKEVFTQMTPPPGGKGGLLNALVGSLMLTGLATLIGTPVGVLAATYLAEFGRNNRLASVIRFVNGILLSAPSVVIGFFVYTVAVAK